MRLFVNLLVTLMLASSQAHGATFTPLNDHPSGIGTTDYSDIDGNKMVGTYSDGATHGFVYDGNYTTLDDPLTIKGTQAVGISGGNVVGVYMSSPNIFQGFLYNGSSYTSVIHPLGTKGTFPKGISGNTIVGSFIDSSSTTHGFQYDGSAFTTLDDPLGIGTTTPTDIDGTNIVGTYNDGKSHGFVYDGVSYTTLDYPSANVKGTQVNGISGNIIVGVYSDLASIFHGFIYNGSSYILFDHPLGVKGTLLQGISGNTIVGSYQDSAGRQHNFLAQIPEPSTGALAATALLTTWFMARRRSKPKRHQVAMWL
jgi:hypothetical protein